MDELIQNKQIKPITCKSTTIKLNAGEKVYRNEHPQCK